MRVTHNMIVNTTLRNLNSNASRLNKLQDQLSSTYRINRLSDDPLALIVSLDSRSKVYAMDQYVKNLDDADSWLTMVEDGMMELNKLIVTIYEDTINAATDAKNSSDRVAIAQKVGEFRDQVLSVANSSITDKYLYGGYNASTQPFSVVNGVLYYNGMSMTSSTYADVNVEEFIHKGLNALFTQTDAAITAVPTMTTGEMIDMNKEMVAAMETVLGAARTVYASRVVPDLGNPGEYVDQNVPYMVHAMQTVYDANQADWTADQRAAAQAVIDALSEGNAANIAETGKSMTVLDAMKQLEQLSESAQGVARELEQKVGRGELPDSFTAWQFLQQKRDEAKALSDSAVEAADFRLAEEGEKKYEIEVGYGQLLNISMNGVEVMGTGDNNLYKILDDLYFALTREYTDTRYGGEAFVLDTLSWLDGDSLSGIADPADYAAAIQEATAGLADLAAYGANLLSSTYIIDPDYGWEAQVDNIMELLATSPELSAIADEAEYEAALSYVSGGVQAAAQAGLDLLKDKRNTHITITQAMQEAFADYVSGTAAPAPLTGMPAEATQAVLDMIDSVRLGLESGMSYIEASTGLQQTINEISATNAAVSAAVAASDPIADIQAIVAARYDAAHETFAAKQVIKEIPPEMTLEEVYSELAKMIDPSWPEDAQGAAGALISKIREALEAGMSKTEVATNLRMTVEALGQLGATVGASQDSADTAAAIVAAEAAFLTSTQGFTSGSIAEDITPFISPLQKQQTDMMAKLAIIGGRTNRVEILQARYSLDDLNYMTRISKLEDVDMAEAMTMEKVAESVYNASLNVGAKIMQLSLIDFMR